MLPKKLLVVTSLITITWIASSITLFLYAPSLRGPAEEVLLIRIRGDLSDTNKNYVRNTVNVANYRRSRLIVISLDTLGGDVSSVESIMSILDESKIPVVVFVEKKAISGGTYVLMAAHVAIMKSGSQIGSCQPVTITGEPITESKYINYLTELMRNHAWLHSRNETAAKLFVTENLNLNGEKAFRSEVIDFIADSLQDMLSKLTNYTLVKYKDEEALRFILARKEEIGKYEAIQSWDFENINEAPIREFRSTVEFLSLPSFLFEFPLVLIFPIAPLLPYIYSTLVVPMLSLTVSLSPEILIALFFGVNGAIGVVCIFLMLLKKRNATVQGG